MKTQILTTLILTLIISNLYSQNNKNIDEAKGLEVGTIAPLFTGIEWNSNPYVLEKELKQGPVDLFFYRGAWCPF